MSNCKFILRSHENFQELQLGLWFSWLVCCASVNKVHFKLLYFTSCRQVIMHQRRVVAYKLPSLTCHISIQNLRRDAPMHTTLNFQMLPSLESLTGSHRPFRGFVPHSHLARISDQTSNSCQSELKYLLPKHIYHCFGIAH